MTAPPPAAPPTTALDAGLRLIAKRLSVPAAIVLAPDDAGHLRPVAVTGTWESGALALHDVADAVVSADAHDVTGVVEGARFAAAAELGKGDGVLAVFAAEDRSPDDAWNEAFATSAVLAHGLLQGRDQQTERSRLLYDVAVHPGTFDVRLGLALERAAAALGMDAAVFARVDGGTWTPDAVHDPAGLLPSEDVPLDDTFCAATRMADGAVGVEDSAARGRGGARPAAYLGAPVFAEGRCVGTFSVVGASARPAPFSPDDRVLVESLARWVGSALAGRDRARRLAEHEATLQAFFDGTPMGMGVVRLVHRPDGVDDLEVVTVNAAGAAVFEATPPELAGRLVSQTALGGDLGRLWVGVCHRARDGAATSRFEATHHGPDGPRTYATTVASAGGEGDGQFTFVMEDVTDLRDAVHRLRTREAQLEAIVSEAPVALFTTDGAGRLASARGRGVDALGLDPSQALGRPLADLFERVPEAATALRDAFAGEEVTWTAGADDRTFECRLRPMYGGPGQITGLLGVAVDVTDRERAVTASARARRAADAVAQGRSALITHIDRRVRSPLTSILGYAEILDGDPAPEDVAEVRAVIGRAGERLLQALDDLQDLALLDGAPLHPRPVPTDLAAIVGGVVEESRPAAEASRVALNVWCALPPAPLLLDAAIAERVVRLLVGGAVTAPAGLRVDVRLEADGEDWVTLCVTGGTPAGGALSVGPDLTHRLVEALGGTAREVEGPVPGWVVRLPRRPAPSASATFSPAAVAEPLAPKAPAPGTPAPGREPLGMAGGVGRG